MPRFRSLFLGASLVFFLFAMAVYILSLDTASPPLPRLPQQAAVAPAAPKTPTSFQSLSGPWSAPKPVPKAAPKAPVVEKAPEPIPADRRSLQYLGAMTSDQDVVTYLFKYLPNGTALPLTVGVESKGWTLLKVTPQLFSLQGPGGLFEVTR